ncbi:hypothetical protein FHS57_004710 [Runella defluvii]|uniref:Uncharacterized protein n=1 Tax=Runella defluvii TaxID=370973 RepID=A0A7W6ESG4_9BACT|nr:hypothetical protein [Runella defluvii]
MCKRGVMREELGVISVQGAKGKITMGYFFGNPKDQTENKKQINEFPLICSASLFYFKEKEKLY